MKQLAGVITALVTPFIGDQLDEEGLAENIQFQLENGVAGLVPLGSTGEAATLSPEERDRVIRIAVREAHGRVPVIVGCTDNATRCAIEKVARAKELGADMAIVATPYYNRPTQEGLYRHYKAIDEAVALPVVSYNVPTRTGVNLEPDTLLRIAELRWAVGIKESTGNMGQSAEMLRLTRHLGKPFSVLSGDDSNILPMMAMGATGVISVLSNLIPAEIVSFTRAMATGSLQEAREWQDRLWLLFKVAFIETNPVPIKEAMQYCGLPAGGCRMPLCELRVDSRAKLHQILQQMAIKPRAAVRMR